MDALAQLGWNAFFEAQLTPEDRKLTVARIVEPSRGLSRAICLLGDVWAESSEGPRAAGPAVGDWVLGELRNFDAGTRRLSIKRILDRKTQFSRTAPGGKNYEQILCANLDTLFIVVGLNQDLNVNGIRKYLAAVNGKEIQPVIVVTKGDVIPAPLSITDSIRAVSKETPIHLVSVFEKKGTAELSVYLQKGKTTILMGASGAGKSTLVNHLMGVDAQRVEAVREYDQKGRHTTTGRHLYVLPSGGVIIDSPGIREFQEWKPPKESAQPDSKKPSKPTKRPPRRYRSNEE